MDLRGSWPYICDIARSRLAHNKTPYHESRYGDGIEALGVAGEIVARRFLGLPERVHDCFDGGTDLVYCGVRIDVKATVLTPRIQFRYLQWPVTKFVKADFVLMTAIDPIARMGTVLGYAAANEVASAPVNDTRSTPCHEIPIMELHPAWNLLTYGLRHDPNLFASRTRPRCRLREGGTERVCTA